MSCTSPLSAYRLDSGEIVFSAKSGQGDFIQLPCGQCMGCRLDRARQWAIRCMHESQLHEFNCFITLTYDDAHLPENANLHYPDFQAFMRRFRKAVFPSLIRFYMCGEYGSKAGRPHYHACIFGFDFPDKVYYKKSPKGSKLYTSDMLSSLWSLGHCDIGELNFESAGYVARYVVDKLMGDAAKHPPQFLNKDTGEIFTRVPEFTRMSLKPGIGADFYRKHLSDIFPHDRVVVRGVVSKPPRYYAKLYAKSHPDDWEEVSYRRFLKYRPAENTPERRIAQDICNRARVRRLPRTKF